MEQSWFIEIEIFAVSCCTNVRCIVYFWLNFLQCRVIWHARAASSTEAQCWLFLLLLSVIILWIKAMWFPDTSLWVHFKCPVPGVKLYDISVACDQFGVRSFLVMRAEQVLLWTLQQTTEVQYGRCLTLVCVLSVVTAERQDMRDSSLAASYWICGNLEQGVGAGESHNVFELQNLCERRCSLWRLIVARPYHRCRNTVSGVSYAALKGKSTSFCFSGYRLIYRFLVLTLFCIW